MITMGKHRSLIMFLIFTAGSITAQPDLVNNLTGSVPAVKSFGEEYFPLENRRSFVYKSDLGETSSSVDRKGETYTLTYKSGGITYKQHLVNRPDGIYLTSTENKAYIFKNRITYSKPLPTLPLPLKIGDKWDWEGYEISGDDSVKITVQGHVMGEEDIKIPAGTFKALRISLVTVSADGARNDMIQWLAPDVGLIKMNAKIKGKGFSYFLQKLLGLSEVTFELASVQRK